MSSTTTTTETVASSAAKLTLRPVQTGRLELNGEPTNFGDWRDDLNRDGYAVIKGAIPRQRALAYSDKFYSYIEDL